jgi:two-component system phosphate regulon sensor histidine kinase PhoR
MKKSIFFKVFGGYALIILVMSALLLVFSLAKIRTHYQNTLAAELENLGRALSADVLPLLENGRANDMDVILKKKAKDINARITVIDPQGTVLADSEKDPALMENHMYRPEVMEALTGKIARSLRHSVTVEANMLYMGMPLVKDGRILGVLRLSLYMKDIDALLHGLRASIGRVVLIMAVAALLLALLISFHFTRPIFKLAKAARQVAGGDFETNVAIRHKDEFRELGTAFNLMTVRIRELFDDASRQKEGLANVISSIREAVLVVDKQGLVVLANDGMKALIKENAPEGKSYWEVVRKPKIHEFIGRTQAGGGPVCDEIRLDDKYYLASAAMLDRQGGVVLTLHDLTDLKKVAALKKDFVINASHELRTPLAAILGAVETMEEDGACMDGAVLDILKRHAARLKNIIEDLLKLSELEDKGFKLDVKDVDIQRLAENVLQLFSARIKDKGLAAEVMASGGLPLVKADPYQIEQMLINLVDNAVKFTEKGRIVISLRAEPHEFVIAVEDTGPGIPAEHLPRLFERFYVVDKSRSRKLGGTGLGLAIVKHIVLIHNGTIAVASEEGKGTIFTIKLPLYAVSLSS